MATTLQQLLNAQDARSIQQAIAGADSSTLAELNAALAQDPVIQRAKRTAGAGGPGLSAIQQSPLYPAIVRLIGGGKPGGEFTFNPQAGQVTFGRGMPWGKIAGVALAAGTGASMLSGLGGAGSGAAGTGGATVPAVTTSAPGLLSSTAYGSGMTAGLPVGGAGATG